MQTVDLVSPEKLRGGFYTPEALVKYCWTRISELVPASGGRSLSVLEPSAGSGNFFKFLGGHPVQKCINSVVAVELLKAEASKCKRALAIFPFESKVVNGSILNGSRPKKRDFDVAIGNPPFVRYQFIPNSDLRGISLLASDLGIEMTGVSNLWIPVLLSALEALRIGGVFAFVIPTEFLTGISASVLRKWIYENVSDTQIDIFAAASFPDVLQEVLVLSGRKVKSLRSHRVKVVDRARSRKGAWIHDLDPNAFTWTYLYIRPTLWKAIEEIDFLGFTQMSERAKLSVATVTGANQYFCVTDATVEKYNLDRWIEPLLPRSRYASGLVASVKDHSELSHTEIPRWLLNFNLSKPDPMKFAGAREYILIGEETGLHKRYKTRIRSPWYRVPIVATGQILLSKRSHLFPRLILNRFGGYTTDTVYSGNSHDGKASTARAIVGTFHNSLTLLSAELEGRSFGGGVLELVPSEISRLRIPNCELLAKEFIELDLIAKKGSEESVELITATNALISRKNPGIGKSFFDNVETARQVLLTRRTIRN
ncbi:MAG: hypothetical protein Q8L08_04425 [Candidatus Nanopelagicaceae bacterium]|nr:hypothetical protein [Candidatus Nanopelagicaceae bacterium]